MGRGKNTVKYGLFSNIAYNIKTLAKADGVLLAWVFIGTVARVLFPFAGILTPRIVIDEITSGATPGRFLAVMAIMAGVLVLIHFVHAYVGNKINQDTMHILAADFTIKHSYKLLSMDYANRERPDFIRLNNKVTQTHYHNEGADNFITTLSGLAVNIGGLILFGGILFMVHPIIIVLLALSVLLNGALQRWHRKFDEARREYVGNINRRVWSSRWAVFFAPYGKEMRMYPMRDWLTNSWEFYLSQVRDSDVRSAKRGMVVSITDSLMVLIRDGAAYAFLVYLLLDYRIGFGEFVMLFAAIGGMANWINGILQNGTSLYRSSVEVSDRRETLEYPDSFNPSPGKRVFTDAPEIRLENVSYTYPAEDDEKENKPTLKNINLTVKKGERLAIVGVNGAGKTTLIKIICGFYTPNEGTVFCNSTDIREFNREEYFEKITAVFQTIHMLAENIAVNVAQSAAPDRERVKNCLITAGFWEKVNSLPQGMDTLLVKEVNEDATELSGGEKQKLALARALYKNASLIILDEPTAALDPIAESGLYQQYASLTEGKTSLYISHRLASTRFCDRIILLDGNVIAEEGTHDELMAKGGKYAEMFEIQASYYKEGKDADGSEIGSGEANDR